MPREIKNHALVIEAFQNVDIVSELVEKLPNGEFRNELEMDIILFGRSYRANKVGPYVRLLEFLPGEVIVRENTWESSIFYILVKGRLQASITENTGEARIVGDIPAGNSFGEMALLSGTPRSATVAVAGAEPALVLELTRPALRLLRKLPKFGKFLDRNYRSYGLALSVNEITEFANGEIDANVLQRLTDASRFAVYEDEHVLFREGDPVNRVVFVRNGWLQRVTGADFNPRAADLLFDGENSIGLDFLGAGSCLGLEAIETQGNWKFTATARGRTEVVEIAISRLRDEKQLAKAVVPALKRSATSNTSEKPAPPCDRRVLMATSKEIETGIVDGVNLLVMDMAKCIRCGNCSLACHKVHGHSRLVRRGIHIERPAKPASSSMQSILVPSVCMHCQDAECLTGCPTGAIARFPDGEIDIEPSTCIGCGDCATQCPYHAISMIPADGGRNSEKPKTGFAAALSIFSLAKQKIAPAVTQTENLLAVKCNLCKDTGMNPPGAERAAYSCEENCPTGALLRVNPHEYFDEINSSIGLIRKSKTHAIGENIHKFDRWSFIWNVTGTIVVLIGGVLAAWGTYTFAQDAVFNPNTWLTMRWLTGLTGLAGTAWVMLYPVRKQIYRRRAGALRYWMLSHMYLGILATIVILIHGGTSSGGLLTSSLMISFDLTIATGLFGAVCYMLIPRLMTRIEREPLLLEDLQVRREELRSQLNAASGKEEDAKLGNIIRNDVRRRLLGIRYLLRQYVGKDDLNTMLADARKQFRGVAESLSRVDEAKLMDAVECAATLRRIDALMYLHKLLKAWLAPHVLFTSIMLVLLVLHIIQVIYFTGR